MAEAAEGTVVILSTGGTIVSAGKTPGQLTGYGFAGIGVADLASQIPGLEDRCRVRVEPVFEVGSSNLRASHWVALARAVEKAAAAPETLGIVVTHGTDTMEETAFFLNLVLETEKPVVLTGAMRPATAISAEGPLNILNAVRIAACPEARGRGVMIALNGSICGARDTTKTHTLAPQTFRAPEYGAFGFITGDDIEFISQSAKPHTSAVPFSLGLFREDETLPRVEILFSHADDDGALAKAALSIGTRGIVLACTGHGSVPKALEPVLADAVKSGVPVVRASRVPTGPVLNGKAQFQEAGFVPSRTLSPQKARILLQLLLKAGVTETEAVRQAFLRY